MSLSKLNDQLKADICSFLPFKDINKLAQVNKSIKASLQRRRLDKPEAKLVHFGPKGFSDVMVVTVYFNTDLAVDETKRVKIDLPKNPAEVFKFFNKFKSIDSLELSSVLLEDNAGWENIEVKIRSVELTGCKITMSNETITKFFKKFELVSLGCSNNRPVQSFMTDEIYNDNNSLSIKFAVNTPDDLEENNKLVHKGLIRAVHIVRFGTRMSLSKLNDQLKADICSFLSFNDINKLAQVNKSMKASLQRRRLDKPKAKRIRISPGGVIMVTSIEINNDFLADKTKSVGIDLHESPSEVFNFINKFKSIDNLELFYVGLEDNAGWENIEVKIRSVELHLCSITMSKETLTKFFKKFELVTLEICSYRVHTFITDELFTELARAGTTLHYKGVLYKGIVAVTDATLDTLSSRTIPNEFFLGGLITGITFARIKKMIEDVLKAGMTDIEYDFGILKSDQYHAVCDFMLGEFEGWAEGFDQSLHCIHKQSFGDEYYIIYSDNDDLSIKFAVDIPDDLEENSESDEESDGEAEESDEESDGEAVSDGEVEESDGEVEESDGESDGEEGPINA